MVNIWIFMTFHCKFHHPNWLRFFGGVDTNHQPILDRTAIMVLISAGNGPRRLEDLEEDVRSGTWPDRLAIFSSWIQRKTPNWVKNSWLQQPPTSKPQIPVIWSISKIFLVGIEPICWTMDVGSRFQTPGAWKCRWRKRRSSPGGRPILSYFYITFFNMGRSPKFIKIGKNRFTFWAHPTPQFFFHLIFVGSN